MPLLTKPNKERSKAAYIDALVLAGAIKIAGNDEPFDKNTNPEGVHTLRSGKKSWIYIDHSDVINQPDTFKPFVEAMRDSILTTLPIDQTVFINIHGKTSPQLTGTLAYLLERPQIEIISTHLAELEKGSGKTIRLPREMPAQPIFVFLDSVLTTGNTVAETAALLKKEYPSIFNDARFHLEIGVVRETERALHTLAKEGIRSIGYVATIDDIILEVWPQLSDIQRHALLAEFSHLSPDSLSL